MRGHSFPQAHSGKTRHASIASLSFAGRAEALVNAPREFGLERPFKLALKSLIVLGLLSLMTCLSACDFPTLKSEPLREPPLIPSAPALSEPVVAPPVAYASQYADTEAIQNFSSNLPEAIRHAISLNVLRPATTATVFDPERSITYGEFRQWANDYQKVLSGQSLDPVTAPAPANKQSDEASPQAKPTQPDTAGDPDTLLPAEMLWGSSGVREPSPLTRETLCALGVFLNHQDAKARKLSPAQIASSQPGQTSSSEGGDSGDVPGDTEGALSQVADYAKISPWAQRYVALAYQNNWLETIFNLTPAQITSAEEFSPAQSVSRGEAMLLLDVIFGQRQPAQVRLSGNTSTLTSAKANTSADQSAKATAGQSQTERPLPLGYKQTSQEQGPAGSRSTLQVSGPE